MKKILITTDFSNNSKAGVRFTLQMQSQSNYELVFYHAIEIMKPVSWTEHQYSKLKQERLAENTSLMNRFIENIYTKAGRVPANYSIKLEIGMSPSEMAMNYSKKIKAEFICLSTHGAGRFERIIGTHASELITNSSVPVIIVPKKYRAKPLLQLVYASDFSNLGAELRLLEKFTKPLELKTKVLHYDYLLNIAENKKKLENKIAKYQSASLKFVLKPQNIEHSLSEHLRKDLEREKPSLVVLFTKPNRNWFDRLFNTSEAQSMAFNSKFPLLIFRKG